MKQAAVTAAPLNERCEARGGGWDICMGGMVVIRSWRRAYTGSDQKSETAPEKRLTGGFDGAFFVLLFLFFADSLSLMLGPVRALFMQF